MNYRSDFQTQSYGLTETIDTLSAYGEIDNMNFRTMKGSFLFESDDLYDAALLLSGLADEVNANTAFDTLIFEKPTILEDENA